MMTRSERFRQLEAMLEDEPNDPFLKYAMAMELRKEGDLKASIQALRELTATQPPYVPAFLMTAQQQVELQEISEARATLREGIEEARRQGDGHAASEMGELLAHLGQET